MFIVYEIAFNQVIDTYRKIDVDLRLHNGFVISGTSGNRKSSEVEFGEVFERTQV